MQEQMFVGVDVAKATLCCCIHGRPGFKVVSNAPAEVATWLDTVPQAASIAVESTGRYHQEIVRQAHASGRLVYVLNAADVYHYAKYQGMRGKTDPLDANLIASYLAEHHAKLRPWRPATVRQDRVRELLRCRAAVAIKRSSLRMVLKGVGGLDGVTRSLEERFAAMLEEIETQIRSELEQDQELATVSARLSTITGVGPQASAMFTELFSRVPFANADAAVAYTGLDPRPNDSGNRKGRRRLTKRGNPQLRRQLYLCAFAASHSKALGPLYRAIKDRGFKTTEALVILARKILRIIWAVWKSGTPFDSSRFSQGNPCAQT